MAEVYFSLDIETDGPIPFIYSMRQIGMAAFTLKDGVVGTFTRKLLPFPGATTDPETMDWWMSKPETVELWRQLQVGAQEGVGCMHECDAWIRSFAKLGKPVCCASPAGYDFTFFRCYMVAALDGQETPFKHRCWDARSHAMGVLGKEYNSCGKEGIPQSWQPQDLPHTHDALDDALEQAEQYRNQMKAAIEQRQAAEAWVAIQPLLRRVQTHMNQTANFLKGRFVEDAAALLGVRPE